MLYWVTGTINSSMRLYYESNGPGRQTPYPARIETPTGHALFPAEIIRTPRPWAEQVFNIARWTRMPRGGHFAGMEQPALFVDEVRDFFRVLRG
jgi:microsomal epoxide hydrolase